jgi:hypothetical protein
MEQADARLHRAPNLVEDIALASDHALRGVIVDTSGRPCAGSTVVLLRGAGVTHETTTNDRGEFIFPDVRGGLYRITSRDQTSSVCQVCRVWTPEAAPPAARPLVLLFADAGVTRGQQPIRELFVCHPVLLGALIAAAVAIPIAVHNSGDDRPAGS